MSRVVWIFAGEGPGDGQAGTSVAASFVVVDGSCCCQVRVFVRSWAGAWGQATGAATTTTGHSEMRGSEPHDSVRS